MTGTETTLAAIRARMPVPQEGAARRLGLGLAVLSSAAFGLSGSLARSLLDTGWSPGAVVLARIGGAFVVLLVPALMLLRRTGRPTREQTRHLLAYGVVAVALAQLCFFSAVQHLSVGVALLLEYTAPVMLIGWHWWRRRTPPTAGVLVGAGLAVVGMAGVLEITRGLALDPVGVLWGLAAAVCLCAYFLLAEAGGETPAAPLMMTAAGTGVGAIVVALAGVIGILPLTASARDTTLVGVATSWWVPVLLLVGITAVLAYLTGIVAVRRLGSSAASFVSLTEVIFAVVFALVLLGQSLHPVQLAGGALMLIGIAVVQRRST